MVDQWSLNAVVNLDRCNGECNTFDYLSSRIFALNKTDNVNLNVFSMITRINKSKILAKHNSNFMLKNVI